MSFFRFIRWQTGTILGRIHQQRREEVYLRNTRSFIPLSTRLQLLYSKCNSLSIAVLFMINDIFAVFRPKNDTCFSVNTLDHLYLSESHKTPLLEICTPHCKSKCQKPHRFEGIWNTYKLHGWDSTYLSYSKHWGQ